jgi:hypothetical protein
MLRSIVRYGTTCLLWGPRGVALLSPKQVFRPASSTAFRAAGSPRTPVVPFQPHRSRGPGGGVLFPCPANEMMKEVVDNAPLNF